MIRRLLPGAAPALAFALVLAHAPRSADAAPCAATGSDLVVDANTCQLSGVHTFQNVRVVNVYTDVATGQTATDIQPGTVGKDQSITENPDGTLTIVVLLTGGARTYGDDGQLIAKNSGQVRFENVIDPATGEEISSQLIFGSTGTNDDFCEAVLADWGYS